MASYKERVCIICNSIYVPTSPKQCSCTNPECRAGVRRRAERARSEKSKVHFTRECKVCSAAFDTTDSKRFYCGSVQCEKERVTRKSVAVEARRRGKRSEYCRKRYREVLHPDRVVHDGPWYTVEQVRDFFARENYTLLSDSYVNNREKLLVMCPKGHEWKVSLHAFTGSNGNRCPRCVYQEKSSAPERELREFVASLIGEENVVGNDRSVIAPLELDIYVPAKKLAVEFCGFYWHGEVSSGKSNNYHFNKMMACREKGIRLMTVFEDEYALRPEVIHSRIQNALGCPDRRIYARETTFGAVQKGISKEFFEKHHLQGNTMAKYHFGLFDRDFNVVQIMTFGFSARHHVNKNIPGKVIEMKRMATLPGISVVGGASKLFKNAARILKAEGFDFVKSYCDMRYGNLTPVYETLGFELVCFTKYTPHYFKDGRRVRNQGLRKTPEDRLTGKTEWELRKEEGYDRIWDCGHNTYLFNLHDT